MNEIITENPNLTIINCWKCGNTKKNQIKSFYFVSGNKSDWKICKNISKCSQRWMIEINKLQAQETERTRILSYLTPQIVKDYRNYNFTTKEI